MDRYRSFLWDVLAVALLWVLVIIFTWRIGLAGRVLAGGDVFTYFYPYWAEATRAIRAGRLPLWNPFLFMGVPFLANSQMGFFYPVNWLLWLAFPAHRSVHLTVVLHLSLAALNAYVWGRMSLNLERVAAWGLGAIFALGGYLGAQIEHVNQLQGLAWLPLMLALYDRVSDPRFRASHRRAAFLGLSILIALVLLAGHTQAAFVCLVGLAIYGLGPVLEVVLRHDEWRPLLRRAALLATTAGTGIALAGVQIVPTWELSRHSVRARGLPLKERVSFSLSPFYVGRALLPRFVDSVPPDHIEHVAYVGVAGLALAVVGLAAVIRDRRESRAGGAFPSPSTGLGVLLLTSLGLLFALGVYNPVYLLLARFVPGFAHFRVPARWLALYAIAVAALAGRAVQGIWQGERTGTRTVLAVAVSVTALVLWAVGPMARAGGTGLRWLDIGAWFVLLLMVAGMLVGAPRAPRLTTCALLALLIGELYLAASALPLARATAAQAFTSLRPALAHLVDAGRRDAGPGGRFLSMSDTTFDPGDLSLLNTIYGPQLTDDQLYEFIIATKQKEIASPNLPLAFRVPAVDGYDGGVLPLEHYVTLQRLFLPPASVSIDGRLRENLAVVPDGRWLSLFNVRYLITDKLRDAWIDDVFYDLQHGASLSAGQQAQVAHVPQFQATTLGLVSHLEGADGLPDGAPVGVVTLEFEDGKDRAFELRAGEEASYEVLDGAVGAPPAARLRWSEPAELLSVSFRATLPEGRWVVQGVSLLDERTGSFQPLVVSDRGRFRLVHSGDVKVYEILDTLPRAFVVPFARAVHSDQAALEAMGDSTFDPTSEVLLHADHHACRVENIERASGADSAGDPNEAPLMDASIIDYQPERITVEAHLAGPGYLVLTDAWYPGWQVKVDGEPAAICRADLLFRAVPLGPGPHRIVFAFRPRSQAAGGVLSAVGLALVVLAPGLIFRRSS